MADSYQSITSLPSTVSQNVQNCDDRLLSDDDFDYLYFTKFLYKREIRIISISDLTPASACATIENDMIGHGGSMNVFLSNWQSHAVALKRPRYERRRYNQLMHDIFFEIQVMSHKSLGEHPNIVKLLGLSFSQVASETEWQIYPMLVVEAAHPEYPDLRQYVDSTDRPSPLPLDIVFELIGDIADGLTALHGLGVVHGDIKPENILLFQTERLIAKIADFGSCGIDISRDPPRGGTEAWAPPEFSNFRRNVGEISRDVYSFGLTCGYLATDGEMPQFKLDGNIDQEFWRQTIESCYPSPPISLEVLLQLLRETTDEVSKRNCALSDIRTKLFGRFILPRLLLTIGRIGRLIGCKFHSQKASRLRYKNNSRG